MAGDSPLTLPANIAFKCLHAGRGDLRSRIGPGQHPQFFFPRFLFVELFKHKDRLASAAKLPETELLEALYALVSRLEFVNEANIPVGTWVEAYRLCKGTDEKDTHTLR
jgi:predicted nucleic acid-binding protein